MARAIEYPVYVSPIAVIYNLDGVDEPATSRPTTLGADLRRQHHHLGRRRPSPPTTPTPTCRARRSRRCTAPTARAPRRTSPTTSTRRPADWSYGAVDEWPIKGQAVRAPTAPPASSPRSATARARSATPTRARPATSARPPSRSASDYVGAERRGCLGRARRVDARSQGRDAATDLAIDVNRTSTDRRASTRSSWSRTRWSAPPTTSQDTADLVKAFGVVRDQRGGPERRRQRRRLRSDHRRPARAGPGGDRHDHRQVAPRRPVDARPHERPPGPDLVTRPASVRGQRLMTTDDRRSAPTRLRLAALGDRVFKGLATGCGRRSSCSRWPASRSSSPPKAFPPSPPARESRCPGGDGSVVAYVWPLVFGTLLAAALALHHRRRRSPSASRSSSRTTRRAGSRPCSAT